MPLLPIQNRTRCSAPMLLLVCMQLYGCSITNALLPTAKPDPTPPAQWIAPMPGEGALAHDGQVSALADWWRQQQDPLLIDLIDAAQNVSTSVSAARSRIEQANAERLAANGALLPTMDAGVSAQRRSAFPPFPGGNVYQGSLQASWEIDLFGANRMARDAAQRRAQAHVGLR